ACAAGASPSGASAAVGRTLFSIGSPPLHSVRRRGVAIGGTLLAAGSLRPSRKAPITTSAVAAIVENSANFILLTGGPSSRLVYNASPHVSQPQQEARTR